MNLAEGAFLPQVGFTEAVSYNAPALKGFVPLAQLTGKGVFPKVGVQFVRMGKSSVFFAWLVCEALQDPTIDFFVLYRLTPPLTEKIGLFGLLESVGSFPTADSGNFSLARRLRLGLKFGQFQCGAGTDLDQSESPIFVWGFNIGGFVRQQF
jgi:hypothetical protein